jgi:hypothetical protein
VIGRLRSSNLATGLLGAMVAVSAAASPRTGFFNPGVAPRAPQLMVYFNHPIGGAPGVAGMRPTFGVRFEQVRQVGNNGDPQLVGDPMQHREWLSWQMDTRSDFHISNMQLKLGSRVTYDLGNRRFESLMRASSMRASSVQPLEPAESHGQLVTQLRPLAVLMRPAREATNDNANMREIAAAAIGGVRLGQFAPAARQAQRQGGPLRFETLGRAHTFLRASDR